MLIYCWIRCVFDSVDSEGSSSLNVWIALMLMLFSTAEDPRPSAPSLGLSVDGSPLPRHRLAFMAMPGDSVTLSASPDSSWSADSLTWTLPGGGRAEGATAGFRMPRSHGVWTLRAEDGNRSETYTVIAPVESCRWRTTTLNSFPIGFYGDGNSRRHLPDCFVELMPCDMERRVSTHLTLGQFLCHTEGSFPQYMALQLELADKLEAVLAQVIREYPEACDIHNISGFRTPVYNASIGNETSLSQHLYGGAADVWIESFPANGLMDDIDRNKRVDVFDGERLVEIVRQVEARGEAQVGGASAYRWNRAHGPFVHIDVRGSAARWNTARNLVVSPVI